MLFHLILRTTLWGIINLKVTQMRKLRLKKVNNFLRSKYSEVTKQIQIEIIWHQLPLLTKSIHSSSKLRMSNLWLEDIYMWWGGGGREREREKREIEMINTLESQYKDNLINFCSSINFALVPIVWLNILSYQTLTGRAFSFKKYIFINYRIFLSLIDFSKIFI